jgi:hypothetical protein
VAYKYSPENPDRKPLKLTQQSASDEFHRIVPLGFTLGEARAWYINHVLMPRLRRASLVAVVGSIILLSMFSRLGEFLDQTLPAHMIVRHPIFISVGFLFAYAAYPLIEVAPKFSMKASRVRALVTKAKLGVKTVSVSVLAAAASLIAFWYLPAQFDAAALSAKVNIEMQVTFLFAGGLIFVGVHFLSKRLRLIAPLIVGKAMGLYGMFLLVTPFDVYAGYPGSEQAYTGVVLLVLMLVLDLTILPLWLYRYFSHPAAVNRPGFD